jgi:hypothetical protein
MASWSLPTVYKKHFSAFCANPGEHIEKYNADKQKYLDEYEDLNNENPSLVSDVVMEIYQEEKEGMDSDDEGAAVDGEAAWKFYRASLVEHYVNNRFVERQLWDEVIEDLTKSFPGLVVSSEEPKILQQISIRLARLNFPSLDTCWQWVSAILSWFARRLDEGGVYLSFYGRLLQDILFYIQTNPLFWISRKIVGSIFWLSRALVLIVFFLTWVWVSVKDSVVAKFPFVGPFLEGPPNTGTSPTSSTLHTTPPTMATTYQPVGKSTGIPQVIDCLIQASKVSLDVFTIEQILEIAQINLMASSAIVSASPFKTSRHSELIAGYDKLQDLLIDLGDSPSNYQVTVECGIQSIKSSLGYALDGARKLSFDTSPVAELSVDQVTRAAQWILRTSSASCILYPLPWNVKSAGLCMLALSATNIIDREIKCWESTISPVLQPKGCWWMLSQPTDITVLEGREKAFKRVKSSYTFVLKDAEAVLEDVSSSLSLPQTQLKASTIVLHEIKKNLSFVRNDLEIKNEERKMIETRILEEWNNRHELNKVWDWFKEKQMEQSHIPTVARLIGQFSLI